MSWAWFAGTAAVTAAALVVIGWQTHWPDAVFGPRHAQPAQLRAATGLGSSSAPAGGSAPVSAVSPAGSASLAAPAAPASSAAPVTTAAPTAAPTSPPVTEPAAPTTAPTGPPPGGAGPAATVQAYYAAITAQDYARAWQLGGQYLGASYADYVAGFGGTATDTVTISSVTGDVVSARLVATQTDGTVRTYQGSYTVTGGVITQFSVQRVS